MGCRTRANEWDARVAAAQQNTRTNRTGYVEGNVVRIVSEPERLKKAKIKRHPKEKVSVKQKDAEKVQNRRLVALGVMAAVVLLALAISLLANVNSNNVHTIRIENLEKELQELTNQNDAREYEISSSIDLNYVIRTATEELGMVRSNSSQIRTYVARDSEYLQQVAEIPKE